MFGVIESNNLISDYVLAISFRGRWCSQYTTGLFLCFVKREYEHNQTEVLTTGSWSN